MTAPKIEISAAARRDLRELTIWLREQADADTAVRFATAVSVSLAKIAETSGIGSPVPTANPALAGIRKLQVSGFPKHLMFYRPRTNGIQLIRALHASQDWWALLGVN